MIENVTNINIFMDWIVLADYLQLHSNASFAAVTLN